MILACHKYAHCAAPHCPQEKHQRIKVNEFACSYTFLCFKSTHVCNILTVRTSLGGVVDTPLFQAAFNGKVAVVKELLTKGAAPNQGSLIPLL